MEHCPERAQRGGFEVDDVESHDKWLLNEWNSTIGKKDSVYIVGDFAFGGIEHVRKLLGKLNGYKYLIVGNHDDAPKRITTHFKQIQQIKMLNIKEQNYEWLDENLQICLCHYPLVTWPSKHYGSLMVHGHCHGRLNEYNNESTDLRVDVGVDSDQFEDIFVNLRTLYEYFKRKTNGIKFSTYAKEMKEMKTMLV